MNTAAIQCTATQPQPMPMPRELFNDQGQRIPQGIVSEVRIPNELPHHPKHNPDEMYHRVTRLRECARANARVSEEWFIKQFRYQIACLHDSIRGNPSIANILKGFWLPVAVPPRATRDVGSALSRLLNVAKKSYEQVPNIQQPIHMTPCNFDNNRTARKQAPDSSEEQYTYNNSRKLVLDISQDMLATRVYSDPQSNHYALFKRMASNWVFGIYFRNPLQGYSIDASREQMRDLRMSCSDSEGEFILSGLDTVAAVGMHPELTYSWNAPGLDLSGLCWKRHTETFCFGGESNASYFDSFGQTNRAFPNCTSSLLFVAKDPEGF